MCIYIYIYIYIYITSLVNMPSGLHSSPESVTGSILFPACPHVFFLPYMVFVYSMGGGGGGGGQGTGLPVITSMLAL